MIGDVTKSVALVRSEAIGHEQDINNLFKMIRPGVLEITTHQLRIVNFA